MLLITCEVSCPCLCSLHVGMLLCEARALYWDIRVCVRLCFAASWWRRMVVHRYVAAWLDIFEGLAWWYCWEGEQGPHTDYANARPHTHTCTRACTQACRKSGMWRALRTYCMPTVHVNRFLCLLSKGQHSIALSCPIRFISLVWYYISNGFTYVSLSVKLMFISSLCVSLCAAELALM